MILLSELLELLVNIKPPYDISERREYTFIQRLDLSKSEEHLSDSINPWINRISLRAVKASYEYFKKTGNHLEWEIESFNL